MSKIAIFSDIHGNIQALEAIINDVKKEQFDYTICLGDVIGIGPNPKEALNLIKKNNIELILGNHEIYYLNQFKENDIFKACINNLEHHKWISNRLDKNDIEYLKNCKLDKIIKFNDIEIKFSHFFLKNNILPDDYPFWEIDLREGKNIEDRRISSNHKYNFFGHIHKKMFFEKNQNIYYCVGSSGCTKSDMTFYTIIEVNNNIFNIRVKEIEFNRKLFEKQINEIEYPEKEEIYNRFFSKH